MEITTYNICDRCGHEPVCNMKREYETTIQSLEKIDTNEAFKVDLRCKYFTRPELTIR